MPPSRVMRGSLAGGRLQIAEAHRFANGPLQQGESLRWDFAKILAGVKRGIALGVEQSGKEIAGISVDSWGVDFGLLDARGELVENPYHYRDRQTEGMLEEAFRCVPKRELYERTGIELRRINSLFQLLAMRLRKDPARPRSAAKPSRSTRWRAPRRWRTCTRASGRRNCSRGSTSRRTFCRRSSNRERSSAG